MAATNPSRAAFVDSISQLTSRGLGQWAGALLILSLCIVSKAQCYAFQLDQFQCVDMLQSLHGAWCVDVLHNNCKVMHVMS